MNLSPKQSCQSNLLKRLKRPWILRDNQDLAREAWRLQAAVLLSRWRWALAHPLTSFDANTWPYRFLNARIGEEPPGVAEEWHSDDGLKLRYNWPNLVKAEPSQVPGWLRDIAAAALDYGWLVLRSGGALVFYTPDGLSYETVECEDPGLPQGLVRHAILRRLQRLGLPMYYGTRGQSLLGPDREHLLGDLTPGREDESTSG